MAPLRTKYVRAHQLIILFLFAVSIYSPVQGAPSQRTSLDLPVRYIDDEAVPRPTPERRAKLISAANAFANTVTRGSMQDVSSLLGQLYPDGIKDPLAYGLVFGMREPYESTGFRTQLQRFSRIGMLIYHIDRLTARVYYYDMTRISAGGILDDQGHCTASGDSYISQTFDWRGNSWRACCLLFDSESDVGCSRGQPGELDDDKSAISALETTRDSSPRWTIKP
jgi:hypothetical protein